MVIGNGPFTRSALWVKGEGFLVGSAQVELCLPLKRRQGLRVLEE